MNDSELELGENAVSRIQGDWDVDTVTEQIFGELKGTVARSIIQKVIKDVIPKYEGALINTFVPIFIRRDVVDQLKAMQALLATPAMEAVKAMIDSEIIQEKAAQEAVEVLVAADIVEEAMADFLAAAVLTADMNETVTE